MPTRSHSLVKLLATVGLYMAAGLQGAASTRRGYAADLRRFAHYSQHRELGYLLAEVSTVASYVSQLADRGKSMVPSAATWRLLPSSTS